MFLFRMETFLNARSLKVLSLRTSAARPAKRHKPTKLIHWIAYSAQTIKTRDGSLSGLAPFRWDSLISGRLDKDVWPSRFERT